MDSSKQFWSLPSPWKPNTQYRKVILRQLIVIFARFLLNWFDTEILSESESMSNASQLPKLSREDVLQKLESPGKPDLSHTDLSGVNLAGLNLSKVKFAGCNLRSASLQESDLSSADLSRADCRYADFSKADLARADLSDAYLRDTNLDGASLFRAKLDGANLYDASLNKTNLHRATFQGTRIQRESLGNAVLHDSDVDYKNFLLWIFRFRPAEERQYLVESTFPNRLIHAEQVHRSLKIAFTNDGQYAAASWAYIRERQIRRQQRNPRNAKHHFPHEYPNEGRLLLLRRFWFYVKYVVLWLLDWTAEITCGYGEKPMRTVALSLIILLGFPFLYALEGGIKSTVDAMTPLDYFNYSLASFTTLGFSEFEPTTPMAQTLTSLEAMLGISILALLMFVLGNRISRA